MRGGRWLDAGTFAAERRPKRARAPRRAAQQARERGLQMVDFGGTRSRSSPWSARRAGPNRGRDRGRRARTDGRGLHQAHDERRSCRRGDRPQTGHRAGGRRQKPETAPWFAKADF